MVSNVNPTRVNRKEQGNLEVQQYRRRRQDRDRYRRIPQHRAESCISRNPSVVHPEALQSWFP